VCARVSARALEFGAAMKVGFVNVAIGWDLSKLMCLQRG